MTSPGGQEGMRQEGRTMVRMTTRMSPTRPPQKGRETPALVCPQVCSALTKCGMCFFISCCFFVLFSVPTPPHKREHDDSWSMCPKVCQNWGRAIEIEHMLLPARGAQGRATPSLS
eukprot:5095725-Amphidinium_carterae.2